MSNNQEKGNNASNNNIYKVEESVETVTKKDIEETIDFSKSGIKEVFESE